jgi:hypothetical protein
LFQGLERVRRLELISTTCLKSGVLTTHYRRRQPPAGGASRPSEPVIDSG